MTICLEGGPFCLESMGVHLVEQATVVLECCKVPVSVTFDSKEAPALPQGHYRKNLSCPKCQKLVIVDLVKTGNDLKTTQEVIKI